MTGTTSPVFSSDTPNPATLSWQRCAVAMALVAWTLVSSTPAQQSEGPAQSPDLTVPAPEKDGSLQLAHVGFVFDLEISPDSKTLASSGLFGFKLWSLPDGQLQKIVNVGGFETKVDVLVFSSDGGKLALGVNVSGPGIRPERAVKLWARNEKEGSVESIEDFSSDVSALASAKDLLAAGDEGGHVKLISWVDRTVVRSIEAHQGGQDLLPKVSALLFFPDAGTLASASWDRTVKLWTIPDGTLVKTLRGGASGLRSLAVTRDGKILATSASDSSVTLWSLPGAVQLATLEAGVADTYNDSDLAFSPDGKTLAAALSGQKRLRAWSIPDGRIVLNAAGFPHIDRLAFSADGAILAVAGSPGYIALFDTKPFRFRAYTVDPSLRTEPAK
jgi:WD40 repeat protein